MGIDSSNWKAEPSITHLAEARTRGLRKGIIRGFITGVCLWLSFNVLGFRLQWLWRYKPLVDSGSLRGEYFRPADCIQEGDWNSLRLFYASTPSTYLLLDSKNTDVGAGVPDLFVSITALDVPLNGNEGLQLETLELISRGCYSGGTFNIITSPSQPNDTVTFKITSTSKSGSRPRVCKASHLRHRGVGIFTPECSRFMRNRNLLDYKLQTTMVLPELDDKSGPLLIENFRSDLVNTEQSIGDIGSNVFFKRLSLNGNDESLIQAESVSGANINIRSAGGAIRGTFNTTSNLVLETRNAPIFVNVNVNFTYVYSTTPPGVTATTSNSPIRAKVNLYEHNRPSTPNVPVSQYSVSAITTNSPVDIDIQRAPLNSKLGVTAETSNSPATVSVPSTYEGPFRLSTTVAEAELVEAPDTLDPSGRGRRRSFEYSNIQQGILNGKVYWGDPVPSYPYPGRLPSIVITTTNSPAILTL